MSKSDWHVGCDISGTLCAAASTADLCPHCWPGHPCSNTPEDRAEGREGQPLTDRLGDTWAAPVTVTGFDEEEEQSRG